MKNCTYCGRESDCEAGHCPECGTEFGAEMTETTPRRLRDWDWVKAISRYAGLLLVLVLAYFLSFGPVKRYSGTVVSRTSNATGIGFTAQITVQYPRWVGFIYYPIFSLGFGGGGGGPSDLYGRYLQWWDKPQTQQ